MYFVTNRSDTRACVLTDRANLKAECPESSTLSSSTPDIPLEINDEITKSTDTTGDIVPTENTEEQDKPDLGRAKKFISTCAGTTLDQSFQDNFQIDSHNDDSTNRPHRRCSDVSDMFDIINETANNIKILQSQKNKINSSNDAQANEIKSVDVCDEYKSIENGTSTTNTITNIKSFPNGHCDEPSECSQTIVPVVGMDGAARKMATSDQDIVDELGSIMAEVEDSSCKDPAPEDNHHGPTDEMELSTFSDIAEKGGVDLCSKMESIIAAATRDGSNGVRRTVTTDFNIIGPVNNTMDSNDTGDFSLPNRLYNFIAEATEGMNVEDVYITVDRKGENQHSELSNLVADTFKKLETEVAAFSEKDLPDVPADCSGIIAMDLGLASIYLSSIDKARKAAECERVAAEAGIHANEKFTCYHCSSKWSDYYMVKYHIIWNHIPELEKKQIYRVVPNMNKINLIKRIFTKFQALKEGRKKGKRYLSAFKFRIMLTKRKIKYYKCRQCDFKTPKEYDMRKHKSMKHDKPFFQCDNCSYCTTVKSCLLRHVMAVHTKEKPHQCDFCNYSATQYNTLQEHIMAKHTFERPHECPHCNYASVQKSHLRDHIKCKHTHERNRHCPHCNYRSASSATLRRHVMAKHTHEKPYRCKYCEYTATQSGQLRKHIMAIHTQQKPFHCPHCSYKATQSCSLKIHIRRKHLIHKPYHCNFCKYKCSTNTYLKLHIESKHKSDLKKISA